MARHNRVKSLNANETTLATSGLIDICFLLLIYFLITSIIHLPQSALASLLSGQSRSGKVIHPTVITKEMDGSLFLNTEPTCEAP